ncbi:Metallo-dependent phosphatase [Aureobasidium pullulans]|uniref:Purple acid phosphatase n=1 Tax=Aureobasidium pullulans TaxID=5580 RepID=A0A4S9STM4_AURPU|nr:Metallo-dependent phosphatase [Aureobasidium pullulans]
MDNSTVPMQMRLSYAGTTGMTVSWNTFSKLQAPTVQYGTSQDALILQAQSSDSITYPTSLTYNNHVKITGLQPDTRYYYRILPGGPISSFRTARVPGDGTAFVAAAVVDLGLIGPDGLSETSKNALAPGETSTVDSLIGQVPNFDLLLHPGDVAYADYWLDESIAGYLRNYDFSATKGAALYEKLNNEFYDEMVPITSSKPYMIGPGNHDANCDDGVAYWHNGQWVGGSGLCLAGQTNFTGLINHFRMPSKESGGTGNMWYSFDHGMAHFISLDSETDLGNGLGGPDEGQPLNSGPFGAYQNAQVDWLAADLAAVDRTKTPWIIVMLHRGWYVDYPGGCTACQQAFEPLFNTYGVDLVLTGHNHFYQRNAPTKNGQPDTNELNNPSSPWYIVNGIAGHYGGKAGYTLNPPYSRFVQNQHYGWSRLTFHNCTHLTHDFVVSNDDSVSDTATLYKNRTCSFSDGSPHPSTPSPTCDEWDSNVFATDAGRSYVIECELDRVGNDLNMVWISSNKIEDCLAACDSTPGCVGTSMSGTACYMKKKLGVAKHASYVRGARLIS